MFTDRATYGELQNAPEKIATNILSDRLKKLQLAGIAQKNPDDNRYRLTDKGWALTPILVELSEWGQNHEKSVLETKELIENYRKNPQQFIEALKQKRA